MDDKQQFAVLIDSENISAKYIATIFEELEKYGFASCRRIYGNWSKSNGWTEEILLEYSIIPIQQFSYTQGKNSTDMAMVIDAMDLLYKNKVDGFCLVTSDSDFTRLAMRLREEQKTVVGMGESKTPLALARACNKFVYLNLIGETNKESYDANHKNKYSDEEKNESVTSIKTIEQAITSLFSEDVNEAIDLSTVGQRLCEKFTDFDARNYGYSKLSVFIKEEMPGINIIKKDNHNYITKDELSPETIKKEIIRIINRSNGKIENLTSMVDEIKKTYPNFELKDYGFSRISSYLRSINELYVRGNTVRLK